jgi:DNA modification methylase
MPTHLISTQAESEEEFRDIPVDLKSKELEKVEKLDQEAAGRWASKLQVDNTLTRSLVSFQANKGRAVYRWFKYKEAFSADLVEHLLNKYNIARGVLLDPFAGCGTALFAAGGLGMR